MDELTKYFKKIRKHYEDSMPVILADYPNVDVLMCAPIDHMSEKSMWVEIRSAGLPFYPQFPVGEYFADFCDPVKKICIEVDGKKYHKDKEKDAYRQDFFERNGYIVYRISAGDVFSECQLDRLDDDERDPVRDFLCEIKENHYSIVEN